MVTWEQSAKRPDSLRYFPDVVDFVYVFPELPSSQTVTPKQLFSRRTD